MTTIAVNSGHGAKAPERVPMTTSTPPRALSHSSGTNAVLNPLRRRNAAPIDAIFCEGHTTSTGPTAASRSTTASADNAGGITSNPPPD